MVRGWHGAVAGGGNGLTKDRRRGVQRTGRIERTGQDKIAEVRKGRRARRGISRDPRGSGFPRSWREYNEREELNGRGKANVRCIRWDGGLG
jgi:hypothetical protein